MCVYIYIMYVSMYVNMKIYVKKRERVKKEREWDIV